MNIESFFKLSYGLYAIGSQLEGKKAGYIANTAFQVTSTPAQIAISCHKNNFTSKIIAESGFFSISVLHKDAGADLIGKFGYQSSANIDKFSGFKHTISENGAPILQEDCLAWFECKLVKEIDLGSHILFIGELLACEVINTEQEPLTYSYYREKRKGLSPKNAPTYIESAHIENKQEKPETETKGKQYKCSVCGYVYDESAGDHKHGIPGGTSFENLPEDWICPVCGVEKEDFYQL